jgi:hypothetical protein
MYDVYRTRLLPQAAFLAAQGATFLRCEPSSGRFSDLLFADPDGTVEQLAESYFHDAPCSALRFYRAITEIRIAIQKANGTLWDKGDRRG